MGPLNGQCQALSWATPGLSLLGPWGLLCGAHVLPLLISMLVPHGAPDSKILWAPWMANEGHSWATHGLPMMGSMGTCNKLPHGPTYLPLLKPIWPSRGQCTFATTQLTKVHGPMGGPMCVPLETPSSQVIARVTPYGVQWQGQVSMMKLDPAK